MSIEPGVGLSVDDFDTNKHVGLYTPLIDAA